MRSLAVEIPRPCHERWADMHPVEQGRFCANCQKTVVDFSTLSDRELVHRLNQLAETTCGRFHTRQLNRSLCVSVDAAPTRRHWLGLLTTGLLGWQTAQAQLSPTSPPQHKSAISDRRMQTGKSVRDSVGPATDRIITGQVSATAANGVLEPVPRADVYLKGTPYRTSADANGLFRLLVPADLQTTSLTIVAALVGFVTQEVSFTTLPEKAEIVLSEDVNSLEEHILVGEVEVTNYTPSRWQRLKRKFFHKAG